VQPVAIRDLQDSAQAGESSRSVAARVAKARNLQAQRGHGLNAVLSGAVLDEVVNPSAQPKGQNPARSGGGKAEIISSGLSPFAAHRPDHFRSGRGGWAGWGPLYGGSLELSPELDLKPGKTALKTLTTGSIFVKMLTGVKPVLRIKL